MPIKDIFLISGKRMVVTNRIERHDQRMRRDSEYQTIAKAYMK
jgi:translation elongation factor EF-Tu-like GTPase